MREKLLLCGEPNTSKSMTLIYMAIHFPQNKVVIFDPDDGIDKLLGEIGVTLPNLTVIPVTTDWNKLITDYQEVKQSYGAGDWVCFDMVNRLWDLAQAYYSQYVFGESPIQHLMTLKKEADKTSFGGFDGLTDWNLIKRLHNEQILDDAFVRSPFNVIATTGVRQILPVEKAPTTELGNVFAREAKVALEGEKHNIYRADTILYLFKKRGAYWFRRFKDRGRPLDIKQEVEFTGKSLWEAYKEVLGG